MGLFGSKEETNLDKLQIDKSHWGHPEGFLLEVINEYIYLEYRMPNNCFAYFQDLIFKNESEYNSLTLEHCKEEIINLVKEHSESEELEKIIKSSSLNEEGRKISEEKRKANYIKEKKEKEVEKEIKRQEEEKRRHIIERKREEEREIDNKAIKLRLHYQKELPIAQQIYSAYVGGIGRLDKINGNILAISSYKLDEIKEQNETLIKQNEEIIKLLSKIAKE